MSRIITRRNFLKLSSAALAVTAAGWTVPAEARPILEMPVRKLFFHNTHNDEIVGATYWKKGKYVPTALQKFNQIMRDNHNGQIIKMDPKLFDLLHKLQGALGTRSKIEIVSAYRSPETNAKLASYGYGVAKKSFHIQGMALDLRIHGVPTHHIHNAALSLKSGGVGYYPESNFVHVDTGPLRTWGA